MKLSLIMKNNNEPQVTTLTIDNVVQFEFSNIQELSEELSSSSWNFISVITMNDGELKSQYFKLENIWHLSLLK